MKYETYRRINMNKKLKIIIPAAAAVLLAVIIATILALSLSSKAVRKIGGRFIAMPFGADNFLPFADGAVYSTEEGNLYHINYSGKMTWGFKQLDPASRLSAGDDYLTVYSGNKLQVISKDGALVFRKEFDGEITDVATSSKLICASVLDEDGSTPIQVLSDKGTELGDLRLLTGQRLVNFGVSENQNELWVLSVEESALPVYHVDIHRFDPEKKLIASLSVDSETVYSVMMNKSGLFLTGTNSISRYDSTNQLVKQESIYGTQPVFSDCTYTTATHIMSTAKKPYSGLSVIENGEKKHELLLTPAASDITYANNKIYAFVSTRLYVYSVSGKLRATYSLPHPAEKLIPSSDGKAVYVIFDGKVSLLRLP